VLTTLSNDAETNVVKLEEKKPKKS